MLRRHGAGVSLWTVAAVSSQLFWPSTALTLALLKTQTSDPVCASWSCGIRAQLQSSAARHRLHTDLELGPDGVTWQLRTDGVAVVVLR